MQLTPTQIKVFKEKWPKCHCVATKRFGGFKTHMSKVKGDSKFILDLFLASKFTELDFMEAFYAELTLDRKCEDDILNKCATLAVAVDVADTAINLTYTSVKKSKFWEDPS